MEVDWSAVKFCKVVEPVTKRSPEELTLKRVVPDGFKNFKKFPAKPVVLEATMRSPVVEVALTWKYELLAIDAVVVAPM